MIKLSLHQKYWLAPILWLTLIYSIIPFGVPISNFLVINTPFPVEINAVFILILLGLIFMMFFKQKGRRTVSTVGLLFLVVILYACGLMIINVHAERVHFIEYGFLSALIFRAVRLDKDEVSSYVHAALITTLAGSIDEYIQYLTPDRYCQLNDMILNSISGVLGLSWVFIFRREGFKNNTLSKTSRLTSLPILDSDI